MMIDTLLSLSFSFHAHKGTYALLLGSGISRSSGIPTGWEITLDLIVKIAHLRNEDCQDDPVGWYKAAFQCEPNYAQLLASLAPSSASQQQLLKGIFEPTEQEREDGKKLPTGAHQAIARLVRLGYVRVIVTTNFDRLLEIALQSEGIAPIVIASPDAAKGAPPFAHSACTILKIHGDYLDCRIKNSPDALAKYDKVTDGLLDQIFDEYGLIVSGWSADYDTALRAAIERSKSRRYPTYWTALSPPSGAARSIIGLRGAHLIITKSADFFFTSFLEKVEALAEFDRPHPISTQAAVVAVKRYLSEDKYRIALRDLLVAEADSTLAGIETAFGRIDRTMPGNKSAFELMCRIEAACEKLVHAFAHASFYGNRAQAKVTFDAFMRVGANPRTGGVSFANLHRYAALQLVYSAGIAAVAAGNYALLEALASRPSIIKNDFEGTIPASMRIHVHNVLDRQQARGIIPRKERDATPLSDHLFDLLRQPLAPLVASEADYERQFDTFEYLWCLLHVDADFQRPSPAPTSPWTPFGAFIWRRRERGGDWFEHEIAKVIADQNNQWAPIVQGLFGADLTRLTKAYTHTRPLLAKIANEILW